MSVVIHIETIPLGNGSYEFIQTWVDGLSNLDEMTYTEQHESRMFAAMTNLGYACRWLNQASQTRSDICITSDRDGKDTRYGGEHDDLFEAIHSRNEYQKNRLKYIPMYGKYVKFLDRIRELADMNDINFTQNDKPYIEIKYEAKPVIVGKPIYTRAGNWSRDNLLKLSLSGRNNLLTCNACGLSIIVQQSGNFTPFRPVDDTLKVKALIKSPKELMDRFLEDHCKMHGVKK